MTANPSLYFIQTCQQDKLNQSYVIYSLHLKFHMGTQRLTEHETVWKNDAALPSQLAGIIPNLTNERKNAA